MAIPLITIWALLGLLEELVLRCGSSAIVQRKLNGILPRKPDSNPILAGFVLVFGRELLL